MKRPNPLHPDQMTPAARRAELFALLGVGLVRLHERKRLQLSEEYGEIPLHFTPEQSGSAGATTGEPHNED